MTFNWFTEKKVTWDQFRQISEPLPRGDPRWLFRGVSNSAWPLSSSFERACVLYGIKPADRIGTESAMIREFRRRLDRYEPNARGNPEYDELLALMQHHGSPTRLIDFTYSPYVAAYFAFENVKARRRGRVAIWAVNIDALTDRIREDPIKGPMYRSYQDGQTTATFQPLFMPEKNPFDFVLSLSPFRLNDRQAFQRAAFLCQGNIRKSLVTNLKNFMDQPALSSCIIKYSLPSGERDHALFQLDSMNINRITLFPGLSGFAESFGPRMNFFSEIARRSKSRNA